MLEGNVGRAEDKQSERIGQRGYFGARSRKLEAGQSSHSDFSLGTRAQNL